MLREIRQLGFPTVELGHAIRFSLWPGILKAFEDDLIKIQTLHNFCPVPTSIFRPDPNCYEFSDPRASMRTAAIKATEDTIRNAAMFGAKAVILHLGSAGPSGVTRKLEKHLRKGRLPQSHLRRPQGQGRDPAQGIVQAHLAAREAVSRSAGGPGGRAEYPARASRSARTSRNFPTRWSSRKCSRRFRPRSSVTGTILAIRRPRNSSAGTTTSRRWRGPQGRAFSARIFTIAGGRRRTTCPSVMGRSAFTSLLPLIPENAIGVLELAPGTPEEQVIASRHLWNSYVAASG